MIHPRSYGPRDGLPPVILAISVLLAGVLAAFWFSGPVDAPPTFANPALAHQLGELDRQEGPLIPVEVSATVETDPVPHAGDAADDPAIWIHPADPSQSTIIGTDKQGGLAVYDLTGKQLQYLPDGKFNNVDLRYGFPLGGEAIALVTTTNRADDSIAVYRVNAITRELESVAARTIHAAPDAYGLCMFRSSSTGKYYSFVISKTGAVEQWELFEDASGRVDAFNVRTFNLGGKAEGCVADDELGHLYVAEEKVGIWKYGSEPEAGTARTQVDSTGSGGHLTADVEGLAVYYASDGTGYLIASSQGSDSYMAYQRDGDNAFVMSFRIAAGNGVDEVTHTDGLDVTSVSLGPAFPTGILVVQDDRNDGSNQNFKLVPWEAIANSGLPTLMIDTGWDPRQVPAESMLVGTAT